MADPNSNPDTNPDTRLRTPSRTERHRTAASGQGFLRQVVVVYAVGALFLALAAVVWLGGEVLLLLFACILLALLLYMASTKVQRWMPVSRGVALTIVVVASCVVIGLGGWLMAPQIGEQSGTLADALPKALDKVRAMLEDMPLLRSLGASLPSNEDLMRQMGSVLPRTGLFFSGLLGVIGNIAIILFVGIYFAAQPRLYIEGIITLAPFGKRERVREVLEEIATTLSQWLAGKLLSMLVVAVASTAGLLLLDVPLALVLGILAGLLDFVPYVGPIMAGVPAVLVAFSESPATALYVVLLFVFIQTAEGYLLLPLVERRTVSLPPALTIMMQALLGAMWGFAGVALATPIAAVAAVLVSMLYVQDMLGDPVRTPSESGDAG
ncbi:AI-2E family transporter [Noviherbaspirillum sp. 1P10PC]|uniref:AI-2E family transporter n=1 Tax=Noviherbaspirillum sp. 1P10PC TaxID=3132292 RepID=UPI0039A1CDB0